LHRGLPVRNFERPEGIEEAFVCLVDGLLTNGVCPSGKELFMPGTKPTRTSTVVQKFPINRETQKLALPGTPPELVEEKVMYVFPPQAADWYANLTDDEKKQFPVAPTDFDTRFGGTVASGEVAISFPPNGGYVSGIITTAVTFAPPPQPSQPVDPNNPQPPPPAPAPDPNLSTPGVIPILGNAKGGNWQMYRVYIGPGSAPTPEQFQQIGPDHPNQVDNNLLEYLDLRAFPPGPYTLKVVRLEVDGRVTESAINFTLDNTPPNARLTQPRPGEAFKTPDDEWVDINAAITDDHSISKVEFYAGDVLFETKTTAPFTVKWTIGRSGGTPNFRVVVYDAAGNKSESPSVGVTVTAGATP
jgi:hypothetical protein